MAGFSFMNCMYFNYCYFKCFDYTILQKNPAFFKILFFFVAFYSLLYIAVGVFNEYRFTILNTGRNYFMCEAMLLNVFIMVKGKDITLLDSRDFDKNINWNGLENLYDHFNIYYNTSLLQLKNKINSSLNFKTETPAQTYSADLINGMTLLNLYIDSTNFTFEDPNVVFNKTYKCFDCKNIMGAVVNSCI